MASPQFTTAFMISSMDANSILYRKNSGEIKLCDFKKLIGFGKFYQ